jgi:peptidoglycan hydrolase-like protein with peptidoglycan-binding domain
VTTTDTKASITQVRQDMVTYCNWGVAHHAEINYAESRPMPINLPRLSLPFTTDCSGFATLMAKWAGAADPNGLEYDGEGYTGTMLAHLSHIPQGEASPGDLAVFGVAPGTHVVVLVESGGANGNNPQVVSHGQQGDPCRVPLSVEAASHSGQPVTFLRLEAGDGPAPSPGPSSGNPYIPLAVDGSFGPQTTEALQWKLGVTADGQFGPDTKMALQRYLKVTPDGSIGPVTIRALQAHVGATQDGSWGPQTTEALQRALNAGTF